MRKTLASLGLALGLLHIVHAEPTITLLVGSEEQRVIQVPVDHSIIAAQLKQHFIQSNQNVLPGRKWPVALLDEAQTPIPDAQVLSKVCKK